MADIIFDVDGTLMDVEHRRHFVEKSPRNFKAFRDAMINDTPNEDVVMISKVLFQAGHRIIIATGRLEDDVPLTRRQLVDAGVSWDAMFFRTKKDEFKPDSEIKEKFIARMKADGFNPTMAFDDRQKVVDMWRRNGLRVFQVDKGDF